MVRKVYLDKCTTIFKESEVNFGLNPIVGLNKGLLQSKFLVSFVKDDMDIVTEPTEMGNADSITYRLRMFNCASINPQAITMPIPASDVNGEKERAISFDVVALRCPKYWDRGDGFDGDSEIFITGRAAISYNGCNWYQAKNGIDWEKEGIFTDEDILSEYEKYLSGDIDSLVIDVQHFSYGNEDLNMDITKYVNGIYDGRFTNRGIVLAFLPDDDKDKDITKYVGFFSNNTNTFYEPFVEVRSSEAILDNRANFFYDRNNRLYFFCSDCETVPVCTIDNSEQPVTKQFDGVYYADVMLSHTDYDDEDIITDTWTVDGETVENTFIGRCSNRFANPQLSGKSTGKNIVTLYGINNDERVTMDNDRIVSLLYRQAYSGLHLYPNKSAFYRIYTKDAYRELTVIDWDNVFISGDEMYFKVFTQDFVPSTYYVDIAIDGHIFKDQLHFQIVNELECLVENAETYTH